MPDPGSPINWDSPYPFKVIRSHWPDDPKERLAAGVVVDVQPFELRDRLEDPCQFCGTPVRTDTEDDGHWPFEYPVREGEGTVSYLHDPYRCGEMSAKACESCGTRLRHDRNAFGPSEWQWEAVREPVPGEPEDSPSTKRFRYRQHDPERCAEMRARERTS